MDSPWHCSNKRPSSDSPVLPAENPKKLKPIATLPYSTQENQIQSPSGRSILRHCKFPGSQIPFTQSPPERDKIAPVSKLKKSIDGFIKDMNMFLNELREEKEQDNGHRNDSNLPVEQAAAEETVLAERNGECRKVHLKCSCGKGFDIVFSGNDCYYKLL